MTASPNDAASRERVAKAAAAAGLSEIDIVRSDIELARADLARSVEALSHKLDVKAKARAEWAKLAPYRVPAAAVAGAALLAVLLRRQLRRHHAGRE